MSISTNSLICTTAPQGRYPCYLHLMDRMRVLVKESVQGHKLSQWPEWWCVCQLVRLQLSPDSKENGLSKRWGHGWRQPLAIEQASHCAFMSMERQLIRSVSVCPGLPGPLFVCASYPHIIINNAPFLSQMRPHLDNKLYDHLNYKLLQGRKNTYSLINTL